MPDHGGVRLVAVVSVAAIAGVVGLAALRCSAADDSPPVAPATSRPAYLIIQDEIDRALAERQIAGVLDDVTGWRWPAHLASDVTGQVAWRTHDWGMIMREQRARLGLLRTRWSAIGAAVAVTLGAGGLSMAQAAIDSGDRPVTVSITAERILDTRTNLGLAGRFADATPRDIQVTGSVPVASGGNKTVVPADAIGVLVNVTVVTPTHAGFLSLRPQGATGEPTTSTVNFLPGAVEPNAATVDLNNGKIQIWVKTASNAGSADVLIDVVGYTIGHTHDDRYYTETEVDSGLATKVTGGEITMSYGPGSWTENSVEPLTVFDQFSAGLRLSGDGSANMMLVGPNVRGGVAYTLKEVRYCITLLTGGGLVTQAYVAGHKDTASPAITLDNTNRDTLACHVVTPTTSTRGGDAFVFNIEAAGGAGATVRIGAVTATWDTRTALGAMSEDFTSSSRAPELD